MEFLPWIPKKGQLISLPQDYMYSTDTFHRPPLDGSLSVAELCDWHAEHSPEYPVYEYLDEDGQIVSIKWKRVAPAIHRAGWQILSALKGVKPRANKRAVVGILANSEPISYATTLIAIHRSGNIAFPISPRNSAAAVAHLLGKVQVDLVVLGDEHSVQSLAETAFELLKSSHSDLPETMTMSSFETLFPSPDQPVARLPPMQYELHDTASIVHSSGTTAFPKPIHVRFFNMLNSGRNPYYGERDMTGLRMAVHAVPMYHAMGLSSVPWAATLGTIMTCFKPQVPPRVATAENMIHDAHALKTDLFFCVPSFAEQWAKDPGCIEILKGAQGVLYGGGPMDKATGDRLFAEGVSIFTIYGCSEYGPMNVVLPKTGYKDWQYFAFSRQHVPHLVPEEDGSGNVRVVMLPSHRHAPMISNCMINGIPAFDTNDILAPHPTIPGFWMIYGRADDQIMHSNGEKTNPGPLENICNQDPHVKASIVFGRGRFNAGVLIDPRADYKFDPADEVKLTEFRNMIWPTIEKMNEYAPQHSRVFKEMILVASPHKPFTYTAKNTPRRHALINEYEPEIDALYVAVQETTQAELPPPRTWALLDTKRFVHLVVEKVLDHAIGDSEDLFQSGCDSLQATWIRNSLLHALRATTKVDTRAIPINFVYNHPSISALATYMASLVGSGSSVGADVNGSDASQAMHSMLEKYSRDFPAHYPRQQGDKRSEKDTILVTGTTGSLGSALLVQLLATSSVERIYAVNRKADSPLKERQKAALATRGYPADDVMSSSKIRFVETDIGQEFLGLGPEVYAEIRDTVTHIIHNAWPVNFNLALSTFEPSIKALRGLIDVALSSPHSTPPRFIFISSQGVLRQVDRSKPVVEEYVDAKVAVGTGYSESKWVAEQLLALASRKTPLPSISVREGQITGNDDGAWNTSEWVPSLIKSSIYLGCIPVVPGDVTWLPVTTAARALIEARNAPTELSPLHLAHPRPVPWKALFEPLSRLYGLHGIPYGIWFTRLTQSAEWAQQQQDRKAGTAEAETLAANPALKLLSFFTGCQNALLRSQQEGRPTVAALGMVQLDVTKMSTLAAKEALSEEHLKQLSEQDVTKWIGYWERVNFLPSRK